MRWIVAAALLALAACSEGKSEPKASPAAPASPAPSASPASDAASGEGAKLFASRCGVCHALPDAKSRGDAEWASEVKRMVQQKGAKATPEEEALIVRHLQQANGRD